MTTYVNRRLKCPSCSHVWLEQKIVVKGSDEAFEDCPACNKSNTVHNPRPIDRSVQAGRLAARAVDETYSIAERDYGITNLKDNVQAGETSAIVPSIDAGMSKAIEERGGFFGGGKGVSSHLANHQSAMGLAASAKAERERQGLGNVLDVVQPGMKKAEGVVEHAKRTATHRHKI